MPHVKHFFDYKSPYAYLAQEATYELAAQPGITVEWLPYTLQIDKYLGSAKLDAGGEDTVGTRNDHQWRRVKYSYMDCRREANRRGLTIRGPRKIFDSSIANIGFLFVSQQGDFRPFHDAAFERFFRRELDIDDVASVAGLMTEMRFDATGFETFIASGGRAMHDAIVVEAEAAGVFGVPGYLVDGELFWGLERLVRVREKLGL